MDRPNRNSQEYEKINFLVSIEKKKCIFRFDNGSVMGIGGRCKKEKKVT